MFAVVCARPRRRGSRFYRHYPLPTPTNTPYILRIICLTRQEGEARRLVDALETKRRTRAQRRRQRLGEPPARILLFRRPGDRNVVDAAE
jgi:hypothetical protein